MKKSLILFSMFFSFFLFFDNVKAAPVPDLLFGIRHYTVDNGSSQSYSFTSQFGTQIPVMIVSQPVTFTYYDLNGIDFSFYSPVQGTGIAYDIELSYTVGFEGLMSVFNTWYLNGQYGYSLSFEQGVISSQNTSLKLLSHNSSAFRVSVTTSVLLKNSVELRTIATNLISKLAVCSPTTHFCSNSVNAQLSDVQIKVVISEDPNTALIGSINQQLSNITSIFTSQNQTIINQNNQTNQNLKDINDTLNDDTPPSSDISSLGNVTGLLPPGPVDSLLNIPAQFLSVVTSSLGGQCKPLSGTWVYDQTLTFPCFDQIIWNDFEDETLLQFLELIPCAFILIMYFKHLYKKVDRATSMNSNSDDEWGVI